MKKATLFVGLNDKDQHVKIISTADALQLTARAVLSKFAGATLTACQGIYTHQDGSIVFEDSIRIEILDYEDGPLAALVDYLKTALNQECVLVESSEPVAAFV